MSGRDAVGARPVAVNNEMSDMRDMTCSVILVSLGQRRAAQWVEDRMMMSRERRLRSRDKRGCAGWVADGNLLVDSVRVPNAVGASSSQMVDGETLTVWADLVVVSMISRVSRLTRG